MPLLLPFPFAGCDPGSAGVGSTVGASADVAACFVAPGGVASFGDVVGSGCCAVVGVACVTVVAFFFVAGFEFVCAVVAFARLPVLDC